MASFTLRTGEVVLVDDADLEAVLAAGPWYIMRSNPTARNGVGTCYVRSMKAVPGETTLLHRLLMGLRKGDRLTVDHINEDGLDNRRFNLEVVTYHENSRRARERHAARRAA